MGRGRPPPEASPPPEAEIGVCLPFTFQYLQYERWCPCAFVTAKLTSGDPGQEQGEDTRTGGSQSTWTPSPKDGRGAQVDPPAPEFDEQQDVERPEPGGLDGEEVAGNDPIRMSPEELGPARSGPHRGPNHVARSGAGCGSSSQPPGSRAHGARLGCHAAPARGLPRDAEDEFTDLGIERWPCRPTGPAVRPFLLTSSRSQRTSVAGVTMKQAQRSRGIAQLAAASSTQDEDLEILGAIVVASAHPTMRPIRESGSPTSTTHRNDQLHVAATVSLRPTAAWQPSARPCPRQELRRSGSGSK